MLLDHANLAFNEGCMFICCGTKFNLHSVEVVAKELKFTIHKDTLQLEASFGIDGLDFFQCCKDGGRLAVWQMLCTCESNILADGCKKKGFVDDKNVGNYCDMSVCGWDLRGYGNIIQENWKWGLTDVLSLQS